MIEVEVKAKISNFTGFRQKARQLGKYKGKEKKIDFYYTLEGGGHYPAKSLRIRKKKGFYEINFKRKLSYIKGVYAKKEIEFKVKNVGWFVALMKEFGFRMWLKKEKTSEIYEVKKNLHIELNNVKGLGNFVEVEYLCNENEINRARKEVFDIIRRLGIRNRQIEKRGYTKILWDKKK